MTLEQQRRLILPVFKEAMQEIDRSGSFTPLGDDHLDQLLNGYSKGVSRRQTIINFTKWMHDFNVSDVDMDLALLVGEVSEVLLARSEGKDLDTVEELADVVIYCYGIANMLGMDLDAVIESKMKYNYQRNYMKEK